MRIAALGDIHSNHFALEACLEKIAGMNVDGIAFLGDYVSDCACPQKTMDLLRQAKEEYPTWFIRGNREEYMLGHRENPGDGWAYGSKSGSLLYTYDNLTDADFAFFESMPASMRVVPEGAEPFEICHGSMTRSRCELFPNTQMADEVFGQMQTRLLLCAHTHTAFIIEQDGKTIVNGGAVGMPTKGCTQACFAVIDDSEGFWRPELVRAQYDAERTIREFETSGFSEKAKVWARAVRAALRTGQDCHTECIAMAVGISQGTGVPLEEETTWEFAAQQLGIE